MMPLGQDDRPSPAAGLSLDGFDEKTLGLDHRTSADKTLTRIDLPFRLVSKYLI